MLRFSTPPLSGKSLTGRGFQSFAKSIFGGKKGQHNTANVIASDAECGARQSRAAFTLAEVLITLVIIGVIAALTIPTLMKNYKKHEIETRLKQNYSLIQNALGMAKAEYGDSSNWEEISRPSQPGGKLDVISFFEKYLIPHIKVVKSGKFTLSELGYTTPVYYPDGNTVWMNNSNDTYHKYVLNNGSVIIAEGGAGTNNSDGKRVFYKFYMFIDLNGAKGPNTLAKDIFAYDLPLDGKGNVTFNMFYDFDADTGTYNNYQFPTHEQVLHWCKKVSTTNSAIHCGLLIQMNGWKVPNDYPYKF